MNVRAYIEKSKGNSQGGDCHKACMHMTSILVGSRLATSLQTNIRAANKLSIREATSPVQSTDTLPATVAVRYYVDNKRKQRSHV